MGRVARRDTKPEVELRRELHRRGCRYRIDYRPLAGLRSRADIVFVGPRLAVYVDGCFWHACPEHGVLPRSNTEWWRAKLTANVERDTRVTAALVSAGWEVLRIWEHDDVLDAADHVGGALDRIRGGLAGGLSSKHVFLP